MSSSIRVNSARFFVSLLLLYYTWNPNKQRNWTGRWGAVGVNKVKEQEKMHSFGYRLNALLTFAVTILALMCAMGSLSDNLNTPSPSAEIQVHFTHILVSGCMFRSMICSLLYKPFGLFHFFFNLWFLLCCVWL